ncbi:hypothetical protein F2P45_12795 [Massilia sp. CCM 8733]|uniref:Lipocalin-like domain-containing protein n=1 Tax=Massilia mucilaginosa TaxID=2609282 RepID=A0ABX0NSZ1_9BURK|nr:hypothetical protein [Massilia mucilaginosa]NHZ89884.1 hypothetical protein [Massilia mucilaginosa]
MAPNTNSPSTAQTLIPFTGYYTLNANTGAFLMIDTSMACTSLPGSLGNPVATEYSATVTFSADGETSTQYRRASDFTLTGSQLVIKGADGTVTANLTFTPAAGGMSVSGTFLGKEVNGATPFGPVQLSVWNGTYYQQSVSKAPAAAPYTFTPMLQIDPDGTVSYATDHGMQAVISYWYDYAMFVLGVPSDDPLTPHLYEMGTSSGWGRVAGNAEKGGMLVSIRQQLPVPSL